MILSILTWGYGVPGYINHIVMFVVGCWMIPGLKVNCIPWRSLYSYVKISDKSLPHPYFQFANIKLFFFLEIIPTMMIIFIVDQYFVMLWKKNVELESISCWNCQRTFVYMSAIHIMLYRTAMYYRKIEFNYHVLEPFY